MQPIISDLVERFERGRLSRRELIGVISLLVGGGKALAAESDAAAAISAKGIDHVSVLVSDLERSTEFYRALFGLSVLSEDKPHKIVRLGRERVIISLRDEAPHGTVDHFGVAVENFGKDRVSQALRQRGLVAQENWQYGYYVKDPDGVNVQLI